MTTAAAALARLTKAQLSHEPACLNDPRFTADEHDAEAVFRLAEICAVCPLFDLCQDYAAEAQPATGVWAGRKYNNQYSRNHKPAKS